MLFAYPLYSRAEEEESAQTKDIQIIDNPYEFGFEYDVFKTHKYKITNVSIEDIKERLLTGEPVCFVGRQDKAKRTIKAKWIETALKKEYGVEKIYIINAIITGDLDFQIKENLVDIDESGIDVDEIKKLKKIGIEKTFLISSSIIIQRCLIQGNLNESFQKKYQPIVMLKRFDLKNSLLEKEVDFSYDKFNGTNFKSTNFEGKANFSHAEFNGKAIFKSANFNGEANFWTASFNGKANFSTASFKGEATFKSANFKERVDFMNVGFNGVANFSEADFNDGVDFSSVSLEKANLRNAILANSKLVDTNLKDAIISGVNLTGSQYEPISYPNKGSLERIKGLATVRFDNGKQTGLVKLRAALKESGLRDLEREATYSIEHWKAHWEPWYKNWPKRILFEWTCGYGLKYLQPLLILLGMIFVFSVPYMISIKKYKKDGIWKVWTQDRARKDIGGEKPERLTLRGYKVVLYGFYFSLLSAFHIGWRDLNVGSWISRMQPREYTLKATGWVRVVSGVQSLICIYLLALWVLTQFGRPFD